MYNVATDYAHLVFSSYLSLYPDIVWKPLDICVTRYKVQEFRVVSTI